MIVLLPHCGFLSETSRLLSLRNALEARGVPTLMATHGGPFERVLREAGVPYERLTPMMDDARCARFIRELPGVTAHRGSVLDDDEIRESARAEAKLLVDTKARAVVTGFTLSALISSRLARVPLVTEHAGSFVPPIFERGLLPAPSRSPLPLGWLLPERISRRLANAGPTRVASYCAGFNRVAQELGVETVPSLAALLLGDLTLVTDVPEVTGVPAADLERWVPREPQAYRHAPALRYVGPMFAQLDIPIPDRVARMLDAKGPKAYVALTSAPTELVRAVVERVRAAGAKVIVASTVHELQHLESEDVVVERLLPSHRIFPRVDVGVVAGGQGSVQTAMAAGVPIIGIPLQPEQDWNVESVARLGAARRLSPKLAVTAKLTDAVRSLIRDDAARAAARRIAAVFEGIDGPARAAETMMRWLEERSASKAAA